MNWGRLWKRKEFGGLGVIKLKDMNRPSWVVENSCSDQHQMVIFYPKLQKAIDSSTFWGTLCFSWESRDFQNGGLLLHHTRCIVGNSNSDDTQFWFDTVVWYLFPCLAEVVGNEQVVVADYWKWGAWRPKLNSLARNSLTLEINGLLLVLESSGIRVSNKSNLHSWRWEGSGTFSVASLITSSMMVDVD